MKNCEHEQSENSKVEKTIFGKKFTCKTPVCKSCGSVLWTSEAETKYNKWLAKIFIEEQDRLVLQYSVTEQTEAALALILKNFSTIKEGELVRAIVAIYVDKVLGNKGLSSSIEKMTKLETFTHLKLGSRKSKKVRLKPEMYLELLSWEKLLNMPIAKVVEESLLRVLALSLEGDAKMKEVWKTTFVDNLRLILKAA